MQTRGERESLLVAQLRREATDTTASETREEIADLWAEARADARAAVEDDAIAAAQEAAAKASGAAVVEAAARGCEAPRRRGGRESAPTRSLGQGPTIGPLTPLLLDKSTRAAREPVSAPTFDFNVSLRGLQMERMERTEIFGQHVVSATARSKPGEGANNVWEVDVAAVVLGHEADAPLVRFAAPERISRDPSTALEAAIQTARRALSADESR
jgi:hypothetical protein